VCNSFIEKGKEVGLIFAEILDEDEGVEKKWLGNMEVSNLDKEALGVRKAACRYWVGRWSPDRI
jgi:EEF1A N-terminal glycine/lysine methyltransferase